MVSGRSVQSWTAEVVETGECSRGQAETRQGKLWNSIIAQQLMDDERAGSGAKTCM
jgi:hypothetical protein